MRVRNILTTMYVKTYISSSFSTKHGTANTMIYFSKVCLADVDEVKGQETARHFCDVFGKDSAFFIKCDVTKRDEFESKAINGPLTIFSLYFFCAGPDV